MDNLPRKTSKIIDCVASEDLSDTPCPPCLDAHNFLPRRWVLKSYEKFSVSPINLGSPATLNKKRFNLVPFQIWIRPDRQRLW